MGREYAEGSYMEKAVLDSAKELIIHKEEMERHKKEIEKIEERIEHFKNGYDERYREALDMVENGDDRVQGMKVRDYGHDFPILEEE